jgi:prepilin-type N-terminal cleavage/methylation domain-containing protein
MNVLNVLQRTRKQAARGLTLIELVVVLAILVALVGLVLAFFPGLLGRASKSTSASSLQDVARAVQINFSTSLSYGSGYDSLLNVGGAALFTGLNAGSAGDLTRATLDGPDSAALASLGITTIYHLTLNPGGAVDATFNVTATGTQIPVTASVPVATLTDTAVQAAVRGNYAVQGTPVYVVLGVNKAASIVGGNSILQDAPVRAGANANENPTTSYQRYGLVFLIDGVATRTARFLGAVAFASTGLATAEGNLQEYYSN